MPIKSTKRLFKGMSASAPDNRHESDESILDLQAKLSTLRDPKNEDHAVSTLPQAGLKHVAIIMDGNGRWAQERGLPRSVGHREGVAAARRAIETAKELNLSHLTLYSFSTENWGRPEAEVRDLMHLMRSYIESDLPRLVKENIRIKVIGDKKKLPADIKLLVSRAEKETARNDGYTLQIAFNYGGRDEILRAVQTLAAKVEEGKISASDISEADIATMLDTDGSPDPDLVIRTSGECRISNFLLWQAAYAEYVFLDEYWPDFTREVFVKAVDVYHMRDRRFGRRNAG